MCPCAHLEESETGSVSAGTSPSHDPASNQGMDPAGCGGRETSAEVQPRVLSPGRAPYLDRDSCQKPTFLLAEAHLPRYSDSSPWSPAPTPYTVETASDRSCSNFNPSERWLPAQPRG